MNSASIQPQEPDEFARFLARAGLVIISLVYALLLLLSVAGCSPRIIEHTVIQRDTVKIVQRDSIRFYDRDSIFIREKGDTVYQYVEKWRWRDRVKVDTVYKVRVDSVAVEHIKEVQVEKPISGWRKFTSGAFWWLCGAVLLLLAWTFRKSILKLIKL